jgi:hypothetical protein
MTTSTSTANEPREIARDGYVFGLPLVYIALQADVMINVAKPEGGHRSINSTITESFLMLRTTRSWG